MSTNALRPARELLLKEYRGVLDPLQVHAWLPFRFGGPVLPGCRGPSADPHQPHCPAHPQPAERPQVLAAGGERDAEDVQAVGRLTVMAEARKLTDEAVIEAAAARYYRYFPSLRTTIRPTISTSGCYNRYAIATSVALGQSTGSTRSPWPIPSPARLKRA